MGILKLLRAARKWIRVQLYLEASLDSKPDVSARAITFLSQWVQKFNTTFTQPTAEDKHIISQLIERARSRLPAKLARELAFIVETLPNP